MARRPVRGEQELAAVEPFDAALVVEARTSTDSVLCLPRKRNSPEPTLLVRRPAEFSLFTPSLFSGPPGLGGLEVVEHGAKGVPNSIPFCG